MYFYFLYTINILCQVQQFYRFNMRNMKTKNVITNYF